MSHVSAIVPMRHNSERVPGKNYRLLGGKPLYHHIVETLLQVAEIDDVVIDTDSEKILDDAGKAFPNVKLLLRPSHLRSGDTPMNDVLINTIDQLDSDVILQTHSTNPFLSSNVLSQALTTFSEQSQHFDSVFGVTRVQARLWDAQTQPINHDPAILLRTQDLPPVYLENSCFYIFTPELVRRTGNRIGASPLMVEVPAGEAVDIDEESDFLLAEAIENMRNVRV
ncbi:acylneuraminate cytidylyltransferase family protein [Arthrobacter sp. BHU FT2]|nr:acylneuraminate cytidylyltransferase family protein [Arthrobacter sp. BHU FT2]